MNRLVCAFLTAVLLCASGVTACARNSEGTARTATQEASTSATGTTGTAVTSETSAAPDAPESAQPGVLETTRIPRPPNAIVCPSPRHGPTAVAAVADPAAPRITVSLPDGWSSATGSGDVGAALAASSVAPSPSSTISMLRLPRPARMWNLVGSLKRMISLRLKSPRPTPSSCTVIRGMPAPPASVRCAAIRSRCSRVGSTS